MSIHQPDNKNGIVFNIQRYSIRDGAGIRTVVFLKGCPLRCRWCSNPESQQTNPELAYNKEKCIGGNVCSRCKSLCPHGALKQDENQKIHCQREDCQSCFQCVKACPSTALHVLGKRMQVTEVIKAVETDSMFYYRSGGGLTISGGEPLLQADFVTELLKEAKRHRIDATMETCGYADWSKLKQVVENLNTVIFDIKSMDAGKHKIHTGFSNTLILDNFIRLRQTFPALPILVRTPVIPGFNDSEADIRAILEFLSVFSNIRYELLPYHRLGRQKYTYLGREYPLGNVLLPEERFQELNTYIKTSQKITV